MWLEPRRLDRLATALAFGSWMFESPRRENERRPRKESRCPFDCSRGVVGRILQIASSVSDLHVGSCSLVACLVARSCCRRLCGAYSIAVVPFLWCVAVLGAGKACQRGLRLHHGVWSALPCVRCPRILGGASCVLVVSFGACSREGLLGLPARCCSS